jgi:hypothetical protein
LRTWPRSTAACWTLRCAVRRRMSAARQSCVLCEHQTFRVRLWLAGCATALSACLNALVPFFVRLNTAPASLLCPRVHWQSLAERVCLSIDAHSQRLPATLAGSRLRNVYVYGGQLFPHSLRSSVEGPACSPGLRPHSMGLLSRAGTCCREVCVETTTAGMRPNRVFMLLFAF